MQSGPGADVQQSAEKTPQNPSHQSGLFSRALGRLISSWHRILATARQWTPWFLAACTLALFLATLSIQRVRFDSGAIFSELVASGKVLPLEEFRATFLACNSGGQEKICDTVSENVALRFPDVAGVAAAVSKLPRAATHVVLTHALTPAEKSWAQKEKVFSLVSLRTVHVETTLGLKSQKRAVGNGSTVTFRVDDNELSQGGDTLALSLDIAGLPWFGPGEFPILLAAEEATAPVQALAQQHLSAADSGRQLQLAIPFVLAVLALVLDHAPVFRALALLSGFRAARTFAAVFFEDGMGMSLLASSPITLHALVGALNGACSAGFIAVATALAGTPDALRRKLRPALALAPVCFAVAFVVIPDAWVKGDLIADGVGAGFAALVSLLALRRFMSASPHLGSSLSDRKRARLEHLTEQLSVALAFVLFALLSYANAVEIGNHGAKALVDWKYALFYPGLLLLAFARVGASSRIIDALADDITRKRLLEGELSGAKKQMHLMQGPPRGRAAGVTWRVWQRQCVSVGGDFFDVRKLSFSDGELLVAVVLDVTGHGIQAAMIARSLSDAWATWCSDSMRERRRGMNEISELRARPKTREEREHFLSLAPQRLLAHVSAARAPGTCTAVFGLMDSHSGEVTICNAGHPSPVSVGPLSHRALSPKGLHPMIGASADLAEWTSTTYPVTNEAVFLFSDGLFCDELGTRPSAFAKSFRLPGVKRTAPHDPATLWKLFRLTQRFYGAHHPKDEDDITLVSLQFVGERPAESAVPEVS